MRPVVPENDIFGAYAWVFVQRARRNYGKVSFFGNAGYWRSTFSAEIPPKNLRGFQFEIAYQVFTMGPAQIIRRCENIAGMCRARGLPAS